MTIERSTEVFPLYLATWLRGLLFKRFVVLTKRIIPCLDVDKGRVVKGTKFKNLIDAGDPVEVAEKYDKEGADELVLLDITASHEGRKHILDVIEKTAERVFMPFTVGGGIKNLDDIRAILNAGADKVSINSTAVKNPEIIREAALAFGSQCITIAVDAKKKLNTSSDSWEVYVHGGRIATGIDVGEWVSRVCELGAGEILLTSMDCDGTKEGYDIPLTRMVSERVNVPVIASGGCGNIEHMAQVITEGKADAVLAASIFHYRTHSIREVKTYLKDLNLPARL